MQDNSTRPSSLSSLAEGWMNEVVRLQPQTGRVRFLLRIRRERCPDCPAGVRTISVWVTRQGKGEIVSWCGHCFNATCDPADLDEEHRHRFQTLVAQAADEKGAPPWRAVRPAVEHLERRGLL